ncbi:MAG: hypothetical protein AAFX50_11080 [Acidobacteriota bacterium]
MMTDALTAKGDAELLFLTCPPAAPAPETVAEPDDSDRCYCCGAPRQPGSPTCGHEICEAEFDHHPGEVFEIPPETAGEEFEFGGSVWSVG